MKDRVLVLLFRGENQFWYLLRCSSSNRFSVGAFAEPFTAENWTLQETMCCFRFVLLIGKKKTSHAFKTGSWNLLRFFRASTPAIFMGCRVGAVVRALASHQCVPGSIPEHGVICGLSLLLVLFLAPCSGYSSFSLSLKSNISKFQFDLDYFQALCHEPLVRVIVLALPVFPYVYGKVFRAVHIMPALF